MIVCISIFTYWTLLVYGSSDFGKDDRNVGEFCAKIDELTENFNEKITKTLNTLDTAPGSTTEAEDDENESFKLIEAFKDIEENKKTFEEANTFSAPRPLLLGTPYFTDRNKLLEDQLSKNPTTILSFWSDKVRSKQCCHTPKTPFTPQTLYVHRPKRQVYPSTIQ